MATGQAEQQRARSRAGGWALRNWVSIALALIALVYGSAVTILHDDTVSPIDGVVYIDYAYKVWDQGMVHQGELFGDDVAHLVACENVLPHGNLGQECGSDRVYLEGMPNQGYTTGAGYTPVYFWTVRIIGDPIHAITGLSEVTSWRLSGVAWLMGTLLVLVPLLRRAGVSALTTFTLAALFIASPYTWWTYTYLSTDASVVLFGAAVLLLAMEIVRGRRSAWWLLPFAVIGPLFKITNLLVFGLVLIYFAIDAIARWRARAKSVAVATRTLEPALVEGAAPVDGIAPSEALPRARRAGRLWIPVAVAVAIAGIVQVAWMRLIPMLAVTDTIVDQGVSTPLTGTGLIQLVLQGITGPIMHNPFAGHSSSPIPSQVFVPLSWLMIAAVIGAMMVIRWDAERGPIIWATGIASLTALPALGVAMWVLTNSYFDLPGRYGAALIPAVLLVAGFMLRNRVATVVTLIYAIGLMVFGLALAVYVGVAY